jgi:hypothetical protein
LKIPEPLFVVVNLVVRVLLASPLHFLMSGSVMVMFYTGKKSGRNFSTPVRYLQTGDAVRCFTSCDTQWWRNFQEPTEVSLLIGGHRASYRATAQRLEPAVTRVKLRDFLQAYPQDRVYHDIRVDDTGDLNNEDLEAAVARAVVVDMYPLQQ